MNKLKTKFFKIVTYNIMITLIFANKIYGSQALESKNIRTSIVPIIENEELNQNEPFDIEIPPPISEKKGKLLVSGTPGAGQGSYFMLKKCRMASSNVPMKWGCKPIDGSTYLHRLNETLTLEPGFYEIKYFSRDSTYVIDSGVPKYIKVTANKTTTFKLQKIKLPILEGYSFRLFIDYTDFSAQESLLKTLWGDSNHEKMVYSYCGKSLACTGFLSDDYHKLAGTAIFFNSNGEMNTFYINLDEFATSWSRRYIGSYAYGGDFISVVPGVYGIEFRDSKGLITVKYGIHVE